MSARIQKQCLLRMETNLTLDERLAEVLDFSAPGYRRMKVTEYGVYRHAAMSSLAAHCLAQLPDDWAQRLYLEMAERSNRFGRVNADFIADLPVGGIVSFPEALDAELPDGELSLRLFLAGEHGEDGFHVYSVALHPEEMDAAMRHTFGEAYAEEDDPLGRE